MPNVFKYTTGAAPASTLKKGNFYIGNNVADYGTTFYTGISPASGGYTIYLNKASGGPSIYVAANDSQLISFTNHIAGTNYTTINQCFNYFAGQSDKMVVQRDYEGIVTDGLVLNLDAGYLPSYPQNGTSWYDLGPSGNTGTLTNGPTFNSGNGGSIVFDGVDDFVNCGNNSSLQINQGTISAWVKTTSPGSLYRGIITKQNNYGLFLRDGILITYDWGGGDDRTTGINIADGTWKNVAMTFTTNTGTPSNNTIIYLNGSAVLTTTTKFLDNLIEVQLASGGRNPGTPGGTPGIQQLNGNMAVGLIYNRALTASEVLQNYNAQKSRFGL